jgi:aryl-alcohol dehydrogenase-like predicted oxidoreductase
MHQRTIPVLDRPVGAIGLGCMGMSWAYVAPEARDEAAGIEVIHHAFDAGVTLLDTSDYYGAGHNERLVGRALEGRRDEAVLATKVGLVSTGEPNAPATARDGRPEHIREAVDASLTRLGTEVIDLYYLHRVDPDVPLEETWGAMAELVSDGKVRALGLREVSVEQCDRAQAIHPVAAVQSEFSLWTRDARGGSTADGAPAGDVVAWTAQHEAVFVPFSPLGRGFLTGALDTKTIDASDFRGRLPRFTGDAGAANQAIVDVVRAVATRHGVPPAEVALAWVLAQGDHVVPIPGTTKVKNLEANIAATDLALTDEDLTELDGIPAAVGTRY